MWHRATNGRRLWAGGFERGLLLTMTFFENLIPPPTSQSSIFLSAKNFSPRDAWQSTRKIPPGTGDFQTMKKLTMSGNLCDLQCVSLRFEGPRQVTHPTKS